MYVKSNRVSTYFSGSYSDSLRSDHCTMCPAGTYQNETGGTTCHPCPDPDVLTSVAGADGCHVSVGQLYFLMIPNILQEDINTLQTLFYISKLNKSFT